MEMVYNHQNSGIDEQVEVIFRCKDGMTTYGRIIGESAIGEFAKSRWPLYFAVKQVDEVMSTAQPCDLAYEFGDRLLDIHEYPSGFPRAGEEILTTSNPTWYELTSMTFQRSGGYIGSLSGTRSHYRASMARRRIIRKTTLKSYVVRS
ncbi:uncharacterized protein LOC130787492 isoform X2 [Actinidia eriantha]|uniref:uncharacterized protein LOC130787492 isoform X2 n=1 Tax=Actinidia eriantha TaxID=165200 RepID=UPI00258E2E8B|nr:uncharacterized protein LOC130787492 isoform X2 [Actinidia eriantha]